MAYLEDGGINGSLFSTVDTGHTLPNGVPERKEYFDGGFQGHGFKIWKDENGKYKIEADDLTIRNSFTIFELIVSQIRAVKGSMAITQGSAKVKSVSIIDTNYVIEIEDDINTIVEHDYIRCQKGNKAYHVEVESVNQNYIMVPLSEFDSDTDGIITNPPEAGDEIVQFGNASRLEEYKNRHSAIYLSIDNNEPAIDLMTDIYTKNWDTSLKVRIGGNLPGTDGDRGFYSVNGKIIAVDEEGESIYEINPDGSGFFARGKFSWTASGSPSFSGTILLKTTNGGVWEVNGEGENIIGIPEGKRIVISPNSRDLKIFDDSSKEVFSLEGNIYTEKDFFGGGNDVITIQNMPFEKSISSGVLKEVTPLCDPIIIEDANANISVNPNGHIGLRHSVPLVGARLYFALKLNTYSDETLGTLVNSVVLYETTRTNSTAMIVNFSYATKLPIGYNLIEAYTEIDNKNGGYGNVSLYELNAAITYNGHISKFFGNGIVIGDSSDNLFQIIYKEGGQSSCKFINTAKGFNLNTDINIPFLIKSNSHWGFPKNLIAQGQFHVSDLNYPRKQRTFDGKLLRIDKLDWSHGPAFKIIFPNEWADYKISELNAICQLTSMGPTTDYPVSVIGIYNDCIKIAYKSDATMGFFEISWL